MVLRVVAQNTPELSDERRFGDCDETHSQMSARLHGLVSTAQVAAALGVLDDSVFVITRRPAKPVTELIGRFIPNWPTTLPSGNGLGLNPHRKK